jgi:Histone methylation protein DOT1
VLCATCSERPREPAAINTRHDHRTPGIAKVKDAHRLKLRSNVTRFNHSLIRLIQRFKTSGPESAIILIVKNLPRPTREWLTRHRARQHQRFDSKYRVDTQMPVPVSDLEASAPGARFANRYEGTPIAALRKIIRRLRVDWSRFTFIDLGSGKGRVLLIAGQHRFRSVVGVEFSQKLHAIALSNIEVFDELGLTKAKIISFNCDAGDFDFSNIKDKIIFCYNPFSEDLMIRVLDNIERSIRQGGETIFLYLGPMPATISVRLSRFPIIRRGEFLSEFGFFEQYSIYKIQ